MTRFEPSLVQIWRTVRPVALAMKPKEKRKKDTPRQWQTGYSPRPPTSPYWSQSLHAGWPPVCSSIFQVSLKSAQWLWNCGWSKITLPHYRYFGHWLHKSLYSNSLYYRTSRDMYTVSQKFTCQLIFCFVSVNKKWVDLSRNKHLTKLCISMC